MRKLAVAGAGIAVLVDLVYLAIISSQGPSREMSLRVPFVAAFVAVLALAAGFAGRGATNRSAPLLLGFSAAGLLAMGVIAAFSIGIALLFAAVPVVAATVLALSRRRLGNGLVQTFGGIVAALAIVVVGIQLTELPIGCPSSGYSSGSGPGLFSGPYHWTCVNGKLTTGPGMCTTGGASVNRSGHVVSTWGC